MAFKPIKKQTTYVVNPIVVHTIIVIDRILRKHSTHTKIDIIKCMREIYKDENDKPIDLKLAKEIVENVLEQANHSLEP